MVAIDPKLEFYNIQFVRCRMNFVAKMKIWIKIMNVHEYRRWKKTLKVLVLRQFYIKFHFISLKINFIKCLVGLLSIIQWNKFRIQGNSFMGICRIKRDRFEMLLRWMWDLVQSIFPTLRPESIARPDEGSISSFVCDVISDVELKVSLRSEAETQPGGSQSDISE